MKNLKKLAGYILCLALVIGCISGCGGFAGKSDEELLMSSITSLNKAKSFEMNTKLTGKISVKAGEQSQDTELNMDMTSTQFTEPMKAKVLMKTSSAGMTMDTESYIQKENDNYVTYTKAGGVWSKMSMGNLDEAMNAAGGMNSMQKQLAEDVSKYTKKEDRKEGDKTYLVYEYKVTGEDMKSMVNSAMSTLGSSLGSDDELSEMLEAMLGKMGDLVMTILIDRDAECIASIEMPMTDMMNNMMSGLVDYMKQQVAEEGGEDTEGMDEYFDQMQMQVTDMNMVAKYSKIDAADDFMIPKEALEAEETSLEDEDLDTDDAGSDLDDAEEEDAES